MIYQCMSNNLFEENMKLINSLSDLFCVITDPIENEWIYANIKIWLESPRNCIFYIVSEDEINDMPDDEIYESEAGPYLPISLRHLDLHPWMEIATL